jgi:polyisoprenoid-binding protein YceI
VKQTAALIAAMTMNALPAAAQCWVPDTANSSVTFIAEQAGAPIEGRFQTFSGRLCIDEAAPTNNSVMLRIDTASVDMGLPEFDDAMRGSDFLDAARWPAATFRGTQLKALGGKKYAVSGQLTIRDKTHAITVPFELSTSGSHATLIGESVITRLDYDLGLGEWSDTRWVGAQVKVKLNVTLHLDPAA